MTPIQIYRSQQSKTERCRRMEEARVREEEAGRQYWVWVWLYLLAWILVALMA